MEYLLIPYAVRYCLLADSGLSANDIENMAQVSKNVRALILAVTRHDTALRMRLTIYREGNEEFEVWRGLPHGQGRSYDSDGNLRQAGQYHRGRREGLWTTYYPSGDRESLATYRKDLLHGVKETWRHNGNPHSQETYHWGILHGPIMTFGSPGEPVCFQGQYCQGQREGSWKAFWASGQPRITGSYQNGLPDGEWNWWSFWGEIVHSVTFADGKIEKGHFSISPTILVASTERLDFNPASYGR